MRQRTSLGRPFRWLWAAYSVSAYGTGLGFGAMPLIAIRVLHAGAGEVSLLSSVGLAAGAALAVPVGPWVEFRRKRPVLIAADVTRFAAQITVPVAYLLGWLTFVQLLLVTVVVAGAKIAFQAAGGAHLKALVGPEQLLTANARFESTTWSSMIVGPPLGGAAIGLIGSVATITADATSYLLSAVGIGMIGSEEPPPDEADRARVGFRELSDGWRHILTHARLRPLFVNAVVVNSTIMATEPLLAVLLLRRLHFQPWQYGLAFAAPCIGGLLGSRLARPLAARAGQTRAMLLAGTLRVGWPIGLALIPAGTSGVLLVIVFELGLVTSCGIFNPILATYRLDQTEPHRVARTLSAWSISTSLGIAIATASWGALSELIGIRAAIAAAGVLALPTPFLLPRLRRTSQGETNRPHPVTTRGSMIRARWALRTQAGSRTMPWGTVRTVTRDDLDLDAVRAELTARRDRDRERLGVLAQRPELGSAVGFGKRIGDGTSEAVSRLTDIGVGESLERGLERTERALAKLDEGTYGICDACGRPITAGRLKAMPEGVLCLDCSASERRVRPPRRR